MRNIAESTEKHGELVGVGTAWDAVCAPSENQEMGRPGLEPGTLRV